MEELNEYEQKMFENLYNLTQLGKWFVIKDDRKDREQFIAVIKKYIDTFGTIEFNGNYTMFRFILPVKCQLWLCDHPKSDYMQWVHDNFNRIRDIYNSKHSKNKWYTIQFEDL